MQRAGAEQEEVPHENGGTPKRPKKRSGRREKERLARQARREKAAARQQEVKEQDSDPVFAEGLQAHDSKQAWVEGASLH